MLHIWRFVAQCTREYLAGEIPALSYFRDLAALLSPQTRGSSGYSEGSNSCTSSQTHIHTGRFGQFFSLHTESHLAFRADNLDLA